MERSGGLIRTKGIAPDVRRGPIAASLVLTVVAGTAHALISWQTAVGSCVSQEPFSGRGARE